jgi:hypothetical protein
MVICVKQMQPATERVALRMMRRGLRQLVVSLLLFLKINKKYNYLIKFKIFIYIFVFLCIPSACTHVTFLATAGAGAPSTGSSEPVDISTVTTIQECAIKCYKNPACVLATTTP